LANRAFGGRPKNNYCHCRANALIFHSMKVRDIIRLIELDGWYLVAQKGSHRQYKHAIKPGRVTIAGKESHDIAPGTRNSVLKQAGLKNTED